MSTKKIFYHGKTGSMKQDLLSKVKLIKNLQQQKNFKKTWLVQKKLVYLKIKEMATVKVMQLELI